MFFSTSFLFLSLSPAIASAGLLPGWLVTERDSNMCGVKGRADTDNNYFYSASKTLASYSGCSARCAVQTRCKSFGYDDSVCMLFDEPLTGNFKANSRIDLTFYDVGCVSATASVTALPSTSTSHVHVTTVHTTKTRTTEVPEPTITGTSGSDDTGSDSSEDTGSDDSDETDSSTDSTTSAVGSLNALVPASTTEATTDVNGDETATATLEATPIATATGASSNFSSGSLSTNGTSFGNGTSLNATVSGTSPFLNTTSISGTNSTN